LARRGRKEVAMATHVLTRNSFTADFAATHPPVLRVAPGDGDLIVFETDDAAYAQLFEYRDMNRLTAPINPITGPVFVERAEPGDALAVTIHDIELAPYGWSLSLPGVGALQEVMGAEMLVRKVPIANGTVQLSDTHSCPAQPMVGCIGVAPGHGAASTLMPSYSTGGNMDLTDAAAGSTVYLPVEVAGALLSIGDVHAVMARGESSFVAIEAAGRVTVSVDVVSGAGLRAPRLDTGRELVFVGLGQPVQESIRRAYEDLFGYLTTTGGLHRDDAYVLMSAIAHSELGGPTGSANPIHPMTPEGAVCLARIDKAAAGMTGRPAI
jgi:amidase